MEQDYRLDQRHHLRVLYSKERIDTEILRVAEEINAAYAGNELLVIVVLKGALFFAADLLRALRIPIRIEFVKLSSYEGYQSTGNVVVRSDLDTEVAGKDVLVVEDIIDTGSTVAFLTDLLRQRGAKTIKVCALIDKKDGSRNAGLAPDFAGFSCNCGFLVGYGLDLNERMRELSAIYEVVENPPED
jgi:hypoxanthine phosphoribosyltransferase